MMNREQFKKFVNQTLEEVICFAEERTGKSLSRRFYFHWFGRETELIVDDIAEEITTRIYLADDQIYPCVDIGVIDYSDDGTLIVSASIAGYDPRPFGKNWAGRDGPFVYMVGQKLIDKAVVVGS